MKNPDTDIADIDGAKNLDTSITNINKVDRTYKPDTSRANINLVEVDGTDRLDDLDTGTIGQTKWKTHIQAQ